MAETNLSRMKRVTGEKRKANGEGPVPPLVPVMNIGKKPRCPKCRVNLVKGESHECEKPAPVAEVKPESAPKKPKKSRTTRFDEEMSNRGRLPDGSQFELTYDETEGWSGTLLISGRDLTFTASASGVYRLLRNLDTFYRDWLKENNNGV